MRGGERLATDKGQSLVNGAEKCPLPCRCPSLTGRGRTRKADYCEIEKLNPPKIPKGFRLWRKPMPRVAYGAKSTVEGCRHIDVLRWNRLGYFHHPSWFSWAWTRDGETVASIRVESTRDRVVLNYRCRSFGEEWSEVSQTVPLTWAACRFGGSRPWFVCSVSKNGRYCGRHVRKLYGAGKLFACQRCYELAYATRRSISSTCGGPAWRQQGEMANSCIIALPTTPFSTCLRRWAGSLSATWPSRTAHAQLFS